MRKTIFQGRLFLRLLWVVALHLCALQGLDAQASQDIAGDIHLKGLLGSKLRIEMMLRCNHERPFFNNADKDCVNLSGEYYYRTQVLPIRLEGRLCPSNGTFFLSAKDGLDETERFEGKWVPKAKQLKGTWTLKKTGKTMEFELAATESGVKEAMIRSYYAALRYELQGEPDHAEGAKIEDAQWTSQGGIIFGFAPNWGGELDLVSPTRLEFHTRYTSTARSSDYHEVYQLLPSTSTAYLVHVFTSSHYEHGYEEGDVIEDATTSCSYAVRVFKVVDDEPEDVTQAVMPADVKVDVDAGSGEGIGCEAYVMRDALRLGNGEKLYWDGGRYVRE
jgi:hypothetical protein